MKTLFEKHLDIVIDDPTIFVYVKENNVVLTGSFVLWLHGLTVLWTPSDLDVAIYQPRETQRTIIETIAEPCLDYKTQEELGELFEVENSAEVVRAWKYEKDGKVINFILEKDPIPDTNLVYSYKGHLFKVQNIDKIIAAKLSYGEGKNKSFLRRKDAQHLCLLKNNNFNIS